MWRVVFLAAGVALFAYLVVQLGPGTIVELIGRIGWNALAIAGIYALHQSLRALALSSAVTGARPIRWRDALWIRFSGEAVQFLTFTGPFLAEPAKAFLLEGRGLTAVEGFAATITEYLTYMFTAAAVSIAAIAWLLADGRLEGSVRVAAIVLLVVMVVFLLSAAVAIVLRTHLLGAIVAGIRKVPFLRGRMHADMPSVHRMEDLLLGIFHDRPARFGRIAALECGSQALHLFELYWIVRALEIAASLGTAFLIEGATKFVGLAFFFVPGQVGASEGAHAVVFELVGLPAAAGFTVPVVRRVRSIAVAAVGLLALSGLSRTKRV